MKCRSNCGMCCIAPSIIQAIPGMPQGKKAGEMCVNMNPEDYSCRIWGHHNYPAFCRSFKPEADFCGHSQDEAQQILTLLERETHPGFSGV